MTSRVTRTAITQHARQYSTRIKYLPSPQARLIDHWQQTAEDAKFLSAAETPETIPALNGQPEVIFIGRANVGKSSLINAVTSRNGLAHSSKRAGRTRALNFFSVGPSPHGSFVLVDAPGYGRVSKQEWGELFLHYIENRQQLRRVYILFNLTHGLLESDKMMLEMLNDKRTSGTIQWTLQAIFTQSDRVTSDVLARVPKLKKDLIKAAPACLPPVFTAAEKPKVGIEGVRSSILEACALPTLL